MATIQLNGINKTSLSTRKISKQAAEAFTEPARWWLGGKNYQVNIQVVEIGSKPKEEKKEKVTTVFFNFYFCLRHN